MLEFYTRVTELLRGRRRFAVATVVATSGSTPRKPGAKLILTETGERHFSIGGGAFEAMVLEDAARALREGEPLLREYQFRERGEGAVGMVCGGRATVLVEVLRGPDRLLLFGGGHVGRALAARAGGLDFEVVLVDDRPEYLDPEDFSPGVGLVPVGPGFSGALPDPDAGTYACVLTRCHRTDLTVLRWLAARPAAYVGVIGSRRKALRLRAQLRSEGVPEAFLDSLRAPIGLDIGARSPEEIAVSILAEVLQVRSRISPRERRVRHLPAAAES